MKRSALSETVHGRVQYLGGGRARYLAPGSITALPGGAIHISPLESSTHHVMLRLGARFGL